MTANAMRGDKQLCLTAGMDDYVSKPINMETVAEKIFYWALRLYPETEARRDQGGDIL